MLDHIHSEEVCSAVVIELIGLVFDIFLTITGQVSFGF